MLRIVGAALTAVCMFAAFNAEAAVCTARSFQTSKGSTGKFYAITTDADAGILASAGFVAAPCDSSPAAIAKYQASVCKMASFGNEAVQDRFTQVLGVAPAKLCASATALSGQVAK